MLGSKITSQTFSQNAVYTISFIIQKLLFVLYKWLINYFSGTLNHACHAKFSCFIHTYFIFHNNSEEIKNKKFKVTYYNVSHKYILHKCFQVCSYSLCGTATIYLLLYNNIKIWLGHSGC